MNSPKRNFIVIDDNKLDCFIGQKIILNSGICEKVFTFLDAGEAVEFIRANQVDDQVEKIVIIVDIQMPLMNGFEFIEAFEELPAETRAHYLIFMLSSTINQNDVNRAKSYTSVISLIGKPLSVSKILLMVEGLPGE